MEIKDVNGVEIVYVEEDVYQKLSAIYRVCAMLLQSEGRLQIVKKGTKIPVPMKTIQESLPSKDECVSESLDKLRKLIEKGVF